MKLQRWWKNWLPTITLIAGGAFTFYKFIYEAEIVPASLPPYLVMSSSLEQLGTKDSLNAVKATMVLENPSRTRVYIVREWYNVTGVQVEQLPEMSDAAYADVVRKSNRTYSSHQRTDRHYRETVARAIGTHEIDMRDRWFDPGQSGRAEFVFFVPGTYDLVRLDGHVVIAKSDPGRFEIARAVDTTGRLTFESPSGTKNTNSTSELFLRRVLEQQKKSP